VRLSYLRRCCVHSRGRVVDCASFQQLRIRSYVVVIVVVFVVRRKAGQGSVTLIKSSARRTPLRVPLRDSRAELVDRVLLLSGPVRERERERERDRVRILSGWRNARARANTEAEHSNCFQWRIHRYPAGLTIAPNSQESSAALARAAPSIATSFRALRQRETASDE